LIRRKRKRTTSSASVVLYLAILLQAVKSEKV
jgi:hypothetical protein